MIISSHDLDHLEDWVRFSYARPHSQFAPQFMDVIELARQQLEIRGEASRSAELRHDIEELEEEISTLRSENSKLKEISRKAQRALEAIGDFRSAHEDFGNGLGI